MENLNALSWIIISLAAFMIGLSKSGLPGTGQLSVLLVALVIPAKASTGLILPMLVAGDLLAVAIYRRHAVWGHLLRLLPYSMTGVVIGYFALGQVNDQQLRPIIGGIILGMMAISLWRKKMARGEESIPQGWGFAAFMGLFGGITTMMANAAGPIVVLYLLAMRLPKQNFIGTAAWYFLIVNLFKIPFSASLNLITPHSLLVNAMFIPLIVVGSFAGVKLAKIIPQKGFDQIMEVLILLAALQLFF